MLRLPLRRAILKHIVEQRRGEWLPVPNVPLQGENAGDANWVNDIRDRRGILSCFAPLGSVRAESQPEYGFEDLVIPWPNSVAQSGPLHVWIAERAGIGK